jgi:hypothetical protein
MQTNQKTIVTKAEKEFCFYKAGNAGGFMTRLIDTIFSADDNNRSKLAQGFPELVEVVNRYNRERGYWEDLQERFENC